VLVRQSGEIAEIMKEESGNSDLVMVGLRQPRPEEKAASYFAHYTLILEALPTTMLVASAPSFEGAPVLFDQSDLEEATEVLEEEGAEVEVDPADDAPAE
jgi:hypothetical protein